jgi:hypothetical protein
VQRIGRGHTASRPSNLRHSPRRSFNLNLEKLLKWRYP